MKKRLTILATAMLMFVAGIAYAQAPVGFNYQAVLRDASGGLITAGNVTMRFTVLQGSASGTNVYQETQTLTPNTYGLVTTVIGTGSQIGANALSGVNWGTDKYYLQVEADPAGGLNFTSLSNTALESVPYALNAATATTAASCSGNAATATTASSCTGNAATATTATTASSCTGNAATATRATFADSAAVAGPFGVTQAHDGSVTFPAGSGVTTLSTSPVTLPQGVYLVQLYNCGLNVSNTNSGYFMTAAAYAVSGTAYSTTTTFDYTNTLYSGAYTGTAPFVLKVQSATASIVFELIDHGGTITNTSTCGSFIYTLIGR